MLFGRDEKILEAKNEDWTFILKLIKSNDIKYHVDKHSHFKTKCLLWGTKEECLKEFNRLKVKYALYTDYELEQAELYKACQKKEKETDAKLEQIALDRLEAQEKDIKKILLVILRRTIKEENTKIKY